MKFLTTLIIIGYISMFNFYGQDISFPPDAGHINMVEVYGCKGDGVTDNTDMIQQALDENFNERAILYFPNGNYLISSTLHFRWKGWEEGKDGASWGPYIIGQSRDNTNIILKDHADGFDDPGDPAAMIVTGEKVAQKFSKQIRNFTVNTGSGNPGAIGIIFYSNNEGMISEVTVISPDENSHTGIHMDYSHENGPLLVRNTLVKGFKTGITTGSLNSQTIYNVTIEEATTGLINSGVASIENLVCRNLRGPAVINNGIMGIINAELNGNDLKETAMQNNGELFARNILAYGYQGVLSSTETFSAVTEGNILNEFVSHPVYRMFNDAPVHSLNMKIKHAPFIEWDGTTEWVSVRDFGAVPNDNKDDSEAIQKAIDAGKSTVYFPKGTYYIEDTVYIRGNVRRIQGMNSNLGGHGRIIFGEGNHPAVIMEAFKWERLHTWTIEHRSSRTLVIEGMIFHLLEGRGSGDIFLTDVLARLKLQQPDQHLWARHLNSEGYDFVDHNFHNAGSNLWILGLKMEKNGLKIMTEKGGNTEITGAHVYPQCRDKLTPLFECRNSNCSFAAIRNLNFCKPCKGYDVYVREVKYDETRDFEKTLIGEGCAENFMLYVGSE